MNHDAQLFSLDSDPAAPTQEKSTCRFPGCLRSPKERSPGARGPRPAFCDDPEHTPGAMFRLRRGIDQIGGAPQPTGDRLGHDDDAPVNAALENARIIHQALRTAADTAAKLTDYLRAGDPIALKAQLRAVTRELIEITADRDDLLVQLAEMTHDAPSNGLAEPPTRETPDAGDHDQVSDSIA